jgi:ubiquinone/menaquinone biosynthesis C-methylase UbiE
MFEVPAAHYDSFMGRYSMHLSAQLADLAEIAPGQRVLDVGAGPGALTAELVARLGPDAVTAVDPSEQFVGALREREPGVTVERAAAEDIPFDDSTFDAALAQLVVHFMDDPVAGLREMGRVTRAGGSVTACVWDHGPGGHGPLSAYYAALHRFDPSQPGESHRPGTRPGHLVELFRAAGLEDLDATTLTVRVEHPTFEDWWEPYMLRVGPTSHYLTSLEPDRLERLKELCREELSAPPFVLEARAWAVRGRATAG